MNTSHTYLLLFIFLFFYFFPITQTVRFSFLEEILRFLQLQLNFHRFLVEFGEIALVFFCFHQLSVFPSILVFFEFPWRVIPMLQTVLCRTM